jgi:hypothetical protein
MWSKRAANTVHKRGADLKHREGPGSYSIEQYPFVGLVFGEFGGVCGDFSDCRHDFWIVKTLKLQQNR